MNVPGFPIKAISGGPGRVGPGGAAGVMIFDVGRSMLVVDPLARFFVEEAGDLEWLRDFVCDTGVIDTIHRAEAQEEEEEVEIDEIYSRADMANPSNIIDEN